MRTLLVLLLGLLAAPSLAAEPKAPPHDILPLGDGFSGTGVSVGHALKEELRAMPGVDAMRPEGVLGPLSGPNWKAWLHLLDKEGYALGRDVLILSVGRGDRGKVWAEPKKEGGRPRRVKPGDEARRIYGERVQSILDKAREARMAVFVTDAPPLDPNRKVTPKDLNPGPPIERACAASPGCVLVPIWAAPGDLAAREALMDVLRKHLRFGID